MDNPRPLRYKSPTNCGSNSVVECQLPKLNVAGSNPVSRSTLNALKRHIS
jgi:hypothetical protein